MSGAETLVAPIAALGLVLAGVAALAATDAAAGALVSGRPVRASLADGCRNAARLLLKEWRRTEVFDGPLWLAAPVLLMALVLAAVAVLPLAPGVIGSDLPVGVVWFTAMFALTMVAVFAAAWGPNSKYPLMAGYRFIGLMLAYEMPFAIAIIAVALPAQSLALGDIVLAQHLLVWNVLLQPLGFAIYLVCALGVAFWGPFEVVGASDIAGGVELEMGGAGLLAWRIGHYALLLAVAGFAVPLYLGGGAGPLLPAVAWSVLKIMAVAGVLCVTRHLVGRLRLDWFMRVAWVWLIPLSLLNLFLVGLVMLLFRDWFGAVI